MKIREKEDSDVEELAGFLTKYWETRNMDYSQDWAESYIKKGHREEIIDDKFFVAKENNDIIGSISIVFWEGGVAELRDFYVKEKHRNEGVGDQLFDNAFEYCRERNVRKIHAKIFPYMLNFFKRKGFRAEGILQDHFEKGEDLIIVGKFLSDN